VLKALFLVNVMTNNFLSRHRIFLKKGSKELWKFHLRAYVSQLCVLCCQGQFHERDVITSKNRPL